MGKFEIWLTETARLWTPERADEFAELLHENLRQRYGSIEDVQLSFDVFDTVLLRSWKSEPERFFEVSCASAPLLPGQSEWDVFVARCRAHSLAYACSPHRDGVPEPSLRYILAGMLALLASDDGALGSLEQAEMAFEAGELSCHPGLKRFLSRYYQNYPVLLISDMYLSSKQIGELVRQHYPDLTFRVYVSNEHQLSKRNGTLFSHVARQERLSGSALLHVGDNFHSDVAQAKRSGWGALQMPVPAEQINLRLEAEKKFAAKVEQHLGVALSELR